MSMDPFSLLSESCHSTLKTCLPMWKPGTRNWTPVLISFLKLGFMIQPNLTPFISQVLSKWRAWLNSPTGEGLLGRNSPSPSASASFSKFCISIRTLMNPCIFSFSFPSSLSLHFFCFSSGEAKPDSLLSKSRICWHMEKKKKKSDPSKSWCFSIWRLWVLELLTGPMSGFILIFRPVIFTLKRKELPARGLCRTRLLSNTFFPGPSPRVPLLLCCLVLILLLTRGPGWWWQERWVGRRLRRRTRWWGSRTPRLALPLHFHLRVLRKSSLEESVCLDAEICLLTQGQISGLVGPWPLVLILWHDCCQ